MARRVANEHARVAWVDYARPSSGCQPSSAPDSPGAAWGRCASPAACSSSRRRAAADACGSPGTGSASALCKRASEAAASSSSSGSAKMTSRLGGLPGGMKAGSSAGAACRPTAGRRPAGLCPWRPPKTGCALMPVACLYVSPLATRRIVSMEHSLTSAHIRTSSTPCACWWRISKTSAGVNCGAGITPPPATRRYYGCACAALRPVRSASPCGPAG